MGKIVISVENLSKAYRLGQIGTGTFSNDLQVWWARMRGKPNPLLKIGQMDHANLDDETIWALRDVSFNVEQGEVLGIIGRNGAGKSTLLKILSRVTAPTSGTVKVKGRIASLLEVGTGFHPDLTGRENIFLNGAILGMTQEEVRRKLDEIINFAEIEKFMDTPVKRYSSGMYVRLAFAVAAHLEPEILLVDEVLAVGDAEFQKKCLGKMGEVAREGRTVLFVSHNLAAVEKLCTRGIVIDHGEFLFTGDQSNAVQYYLAEVTRKFSGQMQYDFLPDSKPKPTPAYIRNAYVASNGKSSEVGYPIGAPLEFHVACQSEFPLRQVALGIGIDNVRGERIVTLHTKFNLSKEIPDPKSNHFSLVCATKNMYLTPGLYKVKLSLENGPVEIHVVNEAFEFTVLATDFYHNGGKYGRGQVLCEQEWKLQDER